MTALKRCRTIHPGVYYIIGTRAGTRNEPEKIYYIMYRKDGKRVEEKAGRQYQDDMTPARANAMRGNRIEGAATNQEGRDKAEAARKAIEDRWTIGRLWKKYKAHNPSLKGMGTDDNRFKLHIDPTCVFRRKNPPIPVKESTPPERSDAGLDYLPPVDVFSQLFV